MSAKQVTKVLVSKAPGYLWYSKIIGEIVVVEQSINNSLEYYKLKGHHHRIIFKCDCIEQY